MATVRYSARFQRDVEAITSLRVLKRVRLAVERLQAFPNSASPNVPDSIVAEFGPDIRKVVVVPFDIVCEYDEALDEIRLLALIHCCQVK